MIQQPHLLGIALVTLVALVQAASQWGPLQRVFSVTPVPFWCYVLPMLGAAAGWWPVESPLYSVLSHALLPLCLALLLLGTDLRAIARMGPNALTVMLAGSLGIMAGMVVATAVWRPWLPGDAWQRLGALAGSWTGGSMNLLAVKEALGMSDRTVAPIIVVDTFIAYSWMALLLVLSPRSTESQKVPGAFLKTVPGTKGVAGQIAGVGIAVVIVLVAQGIARWLPTSTVFTGSTWTIVLVTTAALAASLTPLAQLERRYSISRLGTLCLLVLLASMGARVDPKAFGQAPVFLMTGITAVLVHAGVLVVIGWWRHTPLELLATASQANIGGVVSAPMVAAAYDRKLVPLGLVMAVLGNVIGTYAGLATAMLCRIVQ